jgi:hypothetical protein
LLSLALFRIGAHDDPSCLEDVAARGVLLRGRGNSRNDSAGFLSTAISLSPHVLLLLVTFNESLLVKLTFNTLAFTTHLLLSFLPFGFLRLFLLELLTLTELRGLRFAYRGCLKRLRVVLDNLIVLSLEILFNLSDLHIGHLLQLISLRQRPVQRLKLFSPAD